MGSVQKNCSPAEHFDNSIFWADVKAKKVYGMVFMDPFMGVYIWVPPLLTKNVRRRLPYQYTPCQGVADLAAPTRLSVGFGTLRHTPIGYYLDVCKVVSCRVSLALHNFMFTTQLRERLRAAGVVCGRAS